MKKISLRLGIFISTCLFLLTSCDTLQNTNNTQRAAAIGVAGGAIIGGIIGNNVGDRNNTALGAVIGSVVGGASGAYIGSRMDEQAKRIEEEIPGAEVIRVGEGIAVTFDQNSGVYFGTNEDFINADSKKSLDKLIQIFREYPKTNVVIEGHTDSTGNANYNMDLSRRRAYAVTDYLIKNGVESKRLSTKWFGQEQPKYDNATPEGRTKNRRVELAIVASEELKAEAEEASK